MIGTRSYGSVLGADHSTIEADWIVDRLVSGRGITGVHGAARSGRTSAVVQLVTGCRRGEGRLWTRQIYRAVDRVSIFAANEFAADRYHQQFLDDPGVQVATFALGDVTDVAGWQWAREICSAHDTGLVVLDPMPQCLPEQVVTALAEVSLFRAPVLAVFAGAATTQSIRPDDWRSEFTAGIHLKSEKGATTALHTYSPLCSLDEISVRWNEPARQLVALDANGAVIDENRFVIAEEVVQELGREARYLPKGGGSKVLAEMLMSHRHDAVAALCGDGIRAADIAAAIDLHRAAWDAGVNPATVRTELPDEPPF